MEGSEGVGGREGSRGQSISLCMRLDDKPKAQLAHRCV